MEQIQDMPCIRKHFFRHICDPCSPITQDPEYKSKGYFCGSGAVESGNKVVLQKRLKQSGMRWEAETAQYLLTLKSKYESGRS